MSGFVGEMDLRRWPLLDVSPVTLHCACSAFLAIQGTVTQAEYDTTLTMAEQALQVSLCMGSWGRLSCLLFVGKPEYLETIGFPNLLY